MLAVVYTGKCKVELQERPMPVIENPDEVIVKVHSAGICGSDMHNLLDFDKRPMDTLIPGHEFVGEVYEMGKDVTGWELGDRVVVEPIDTCGKCYACTHGRRNVCKHLVCAGSHKDGAFCEYYKTTADKLFKLPDFLTWHQAVLIEPYTIAGQVNSRAKTAAGDNVLIHGGGPIGIVCMDIAKQLGANVMISEIKPGRLEMAKKMGCDYVVNPMEQDLNEEIAKAFGEEGPNIVMDAAGLPRFEEEAIRMVSPAGTVVNMCFNMAPVHTNLFPFIGKELNLVGSRLQVGQFRNILDNYTDCLIKAEKIFLTHVFPKEEGDKAFELMLENRDDVGKVVVDFC